MQVAEILVTKSFVSYAKILTEVKQGKSVANAVSDAGAIIVENDVKWLWN